MEWYKKTKNEAEEGQKNIKSEIDEIKRLEELAMAEALGIPPLQIVKKELNTAISESLEKTVGDSLGSSSKEEFNVNNSKRQKSSSSHKRKHKKHKRYASVDSHSSSSSVRYHKKQDRKYKDEKYKSNKYY